MNNNAQGGHAGRGLLGLVLVAMGLAALGSSTIWAGVLLLILGVVTMALLYNAGVLNPGEDSQRRPAQRDDRARSRDRSRPGSRYTPSYEQNRPQAAPRHETPQRETPRREVVRREAVHRVAANAIARAGHEAEDLLVQPVDLGLLVYNDLMADPVVYREERVPDDSGYVRPFVVLRTPRRAQGKVRFEISDGSGNSRFVDESQWELRDGETFVYPATWLPLHRLPDFDGRWRLRVYAADTLLAVHTFHWRITGGGAVRTLVDGDGEIKAETLRALSVQRLERLSLDDLLADQEGGALDSDPEAEKAARRAAELHRQRSRR